jgi:hypothetical protein
VAASVSLDAEAAAQLTASVNDLVDKLRGAADAITIITQLVNANTSAASPQPATPPGVLAGSASDGVVMAPPASGGVVSGVQEHAAILQVVPADIAATWPRFFQLHSDESLLQTPTFRPKRPMPSPPAGLGDILDRCLHSLRFGKPHNLGLRHGHFVPLRRLWKLLSMEPSFPLKDAEALATELVYFSIQENNATVFPLELLILNAANSTCPRGYVAIFVRARQDLIRNPRLDHQVPTVPQSQQAPRWGANSWKK